MDCKYFDAPFGINLLVGRVTSGFTCPTQIQLLRTRSSRQAVFSNTVSLYDILNGSRSNWPQTKSAPGQIGPRSNHCIIMFFFHTNYISILYYKPLSLSVYKHIIIQKSYDLYKIHVHSQCYTYSIHNKVMTR